MLYEIKHTLILLAVLLFILLLGIYTVIVDEFIRFKSKISENIKKNDIGDLPDINISCTDNIDDDLNFSVKKPEENELQ